MSPEKSRRPGANVMPPAAPPWRGAPPARPASRAARRSPPRHLRAQLRRASRDRPRRRLQVLQHRDREPVAGAARLLGGEAQAPLALELARQAVLLALLLLDVD